MSFSREVIQVLLHLAQLEVIQDQHLLKGAILEQLLHPLEVTQALLLPKEVIQALLHPKEAIQVRLKILRDLHKRKEKEN